MYHDLLNQPLNCELVVCVQCFVIVNESLRTPVTVPSGFFPEMELLGEDWGSEAHFPDGAEEGSGLSHHLLLSHYLLSGLLS